MVREFALFVAQIVAEKLTDHNVLLSTHFFHSSVSATHRISIAFVSSLLFLRRVRDTLVSSAFTGGQKSSRFTVSRSHPRLNVRFSVLERKEGREKKKKRAKSFDKRLVLYELRCNQIQKRALTFPWHFPAPHRQVPPFHRSVVKLPGSQRYPNVAHP